MRIAASVEKSLNHGLALAEANRHEFFTLEHLLWGALHAPEMIEMLSSMSIDQESLKSDVYAKLQEMDNTLAADANPALTIPVNRVLQRSAEMARNQGKDPSETQVTLWMVLLNMFEEQDCFANYFLETYNVTPLKIKTFASHGNKAFSETGINGAEATPGSEEKNKNPLLKFGVNLNEKAKENKIDPLIGRAYEVERTAQILSRRRKNNPLLVGEPGVGKTAIAEGLAKMIVDDLAPDALKDKQIWALNMGAMLAGTKYRGDFEQRIKDVLEEAAKDENIVLFIDEIHTLIGAGSGGGNSMDASNIIKPALASGELRVIGATTFQEYREIFEKEKALDRRFQKVDVVEPTPSETVEILKGLKKGLESHHGVKYTKAAIQSAVDLSVKYMPDRFLPDKAIDLLDEAGAAERLKPANKRHSFIDTNHIEETVSKVTRIPVTQVSSTEKDSLQALPESLKSVVFGQNEAIDKLSTAVRVAKAGLNDESKPLGSFLFTGPTGVGKTEIVRQLGKSLNLPVLRFDMSEYMEAHSVARLIGSPPGYVGHDKGGLLTDAVFKNPHSIILLDEIEKAHPDVFNILLQVMDHGSLTDSNGRNVNFKNSFVIMTSNSGAQVMAKPTIGFLKSDNSSDGKKVVDLTFSPEFRNRLDAIVSFNSLGFNEIIKIVDKNIDLLRANLINKGVTLEVTDEAKAVLAKEGFIPAMGARPMARLIQEKLKKPLAEKILFGELALGGTAKVDFDTDWNWTITPKEPKPIKVKKKPTTKKAKLKA